MGYFDDCGICGKYYKTCKHYMKEHLPYKDGQALCGRKNVVILKNGWEDTDLDPNDICKHCAKLDNYFQSKYILEDGEYREKGDDEKEYIIYSSEWD